MIKIYLALSIALLSTCLLFSCKKSDEQKQFTFTYFPLSAGNADTVTVATKNLTLADQTPSIKINDQQLTVIKATKDSFKVVIPKLLGSGKVVILLNGKTYNGPDFTYTYKATVTTIAGTGEVGNSDGPAGSAAFNCPWGITSNTNGDLYIADYYNRAVRRISASLILMKEIFIPPITLH